MLSVGIAILLFLPEILYGADTIVIIGVAEIRSFH